MGVNRANVAAQVMEHLCGCPAHGYSQPGRAGSGGECAVATDAGVLRVCSGDRDCSSAVCDAWAAALSGTPFEGAISRGGWTGSMRRMFLDSGLFSWQPMSFDATRGDVYLDEGSHAAMCVRNDGAADLLAEFSLSETGGVDGEVGDQTGRESRVRGYYGGWDGILHYNGKADGATCGPAGSTAELAARVIAGDFGDGDARRAVLGERYGEVQAEVNRMLSGGWGEAPHDDVDALARAVIRGEYGNGDARRAALGERYAAVQARVNEMLS